MEKVVISEKQLPEMVKNILGIAEQAGNIVLKYFKTDLEVKYKEDEFDPVTKADKESDQFIRNEILALFPKDLLFSEENSNIPTSFMERVWMIDPLNGTKSFIRGVDTFAIVIGLMENGLSVFGCVVFPARNEVFYAQKGSGAFEKKGEYYEQIHTSHTNKIEESCLITREPSGDIRPIEEKLNQLSFKERIEGLSGSKLCTIANGGADAHINTNSRIGKWELPAQQIILEEAGGIVTDLDGKPLDYQKESVNLPRSFVASCNKELHEKIITELRKLQI